MNQLRPRSSVEDFPVGCSVRGQVGIILQCNNPDAEEQHLRRELLCYDPHRFQRLGIRCLDWEKEWKKWGIPRDPIRLELMERNILYPSLTWIVENFPANGDFMDHFLGRDDAKTIPTWKAWVYHGVPRLTHITCWLWFLGIPVSMTVQLIGKILKANPF